MTAPGPTRAALEALWVRHRRGWRRLLPPTLRAELDLRARFELTTLDPREVARRVPAGQVPDCPSCLDPCCGGLENLVSLRLVDLATLVDLGRTDLVAVKKPRFPPELVRQRPHLAALAGSTLFRALPVLRQVGPARTCAALTPERRCGLHPAWPTSCARFPYHLDARRREVTWGTRCASAGPGDEARAAALHGAAVAAWNERVRDAVLLTHAREALDALGLGRFLVGAGEDPFEALARSPLPVLREP